jgi:hypothetical protein
MVKRRPRKKSKRKRIKKALKQKKIKKKVKKRKIITSKRIKLEKRLNKAKKLKISAKKKLSPKEARKILGNVSPQYCLWVMSGAILKNLNELARELERMNNQVFRYHVSRERNDFSRWIDEVFGDKKLATDIKKAKTKKQAYKILKSRLNELKSIIAKSK